MSTSQRWIWIALVVALPAAAQHAPVAVDLVPAALASEYGGRLPIGGMIYLRLTPPGGHGTH